MSVLVIAEHNHQSIQASTLNTVSAALAIDSDVHLLVAGHSCEKAANDATSISGINKVLIAEDSAYEHFMAENFAPLIQSLASSYSHILIPSNTFGKNILPRVAALLDVAQITDVIEIISSDTFKRPIYAGNAIATVQSSDSIKLLTIRTTTFAKAELGGSATIESVSSASSSDIASFIELKATDSEGPELTSASIVVSGGRGLGSGENFTLLDTLAKKLGDCAIGASRAAVDAGYVPNDYQVGQTGKVVAPNLYIAVGISGAIQHLAGMKDSKVIVAINKDPEAPIFDIADFGLVADLFDAVPELTEKLP